MNSVKINISNKDFLDFADNMVEITNKFNPNRINTSYLKHNLVKLVINSISTDFIYLRKSNNIFNLNIYSDSNLFKNLDVSVISVSSFFSELLGTELFNNHTNIKYIEVVNAESMKLTFNNYNDTWDIFISINSPIKSIYH
jgi:hypothetical protein